MDASFGTERTPPKRERSNARARDWSRPRIVMMLWERGLSLRSLSRSRGLAPKTLSVALHRPWPRGESIIAEALGVAPEVIWPTRFALRAQRKSKKASA
jgi:Ner family transcriptional regulator